MLQKESISAENKVFRSFPVLSALFVPFWFWQKLATSPLALSVSAETLSSISNLLFVSFHMLFNPCQIKITSVQASFEVSLPLTWVSFPPLGVGDECFFFLLVRASC